ncbi:bacterio-opsin activator domain-containing protein [Halomicrococcus gelatinilyticus]|uniref:bacterio-opsin activator domain-containing protein n=1 Tax=Halomicrococcus gelatinilyticus TaxID=1702103 RepID=UPI002E15DFD1
MDERLQRAPVGVIDVAADGTVRGVNDVAREVLDEHRIQTGVSIEDAFPRSVEDSLVDAFDGAGATAAAFEEYYPELERWLDVSVVPTDDAVTVYLQDVTTQRRHEKSLARHRNERERLVVIDELLSDVLAELVAASSRDEVAQTICERLGETELYEFAWLGEREAGSDDLVVRAAAGETGETFDAVRESLDRPVTTLEERAVESGRVQAVQPLASDSEMPESVRVAGFADGIQSVLAIPLVHGTGVHGVVGVYAAGQEALSPRERTSFETLGEVAGFAITATRNQKLLLSDTITEVAFDVRGDAVLAALSEELDASVSLSGLVSHGTDSFLCYVDVHGATGEDLTAVAAELANVGGVRRIDNADVERSFEIEITGSTPLVEAFSLGATVRRATFEGGDGRLVMELPPGVDVHRIAEAVCRDDETEIVAKRERERPVTTARELRDELGDELTERQETVLRTAYLADYFESPRGSTAEEVADSLGITGSTLLYHLRASQRKLLDAFFSRDDTTTE